MGYKGKWVRREIVAVQRLMTMVCSKLVLFYTILAICVPTTSPIHRNPPLPASFPPSHPRFPCIQSLPFPINMEIPGFEEQLLSHISPTSTSQRLRSEVFTLLRHNIEKCLSRLRPRLVAYGSWPLQTYNPSGDLDVTIVLPQNAGQVQAETVLATVRSQFEFVAKIRPQYAIGDFTEVHADVHLLKFSLKGVSVDLSVNQTSGLFSLRLLEYVDSLTVNHLFKRTLVLVKAWANYESRISGSRYGLLSSYALSVMVLCVLNSYPETRTSPIQVLLKLLEVLSRINWETEVITSFGVLPLSTYTTSDPIGLASPKPDTLFFTPRHLHLLGGVTGRAPDFQTKYIHIADPLKPGNNLGRSVNRGNYLRIQLAIRASLAKCHSEGIESLFRNIRKLPRKANDDGFKFSTELESVHKALREALTVPIEAGKTWETNQTKKVTVAYRY